MSSWAPFRDALLADEPVIRVVRGHIHIEAQLNRFIDHSLPHPERLKFDRWNWHQRVDLAVGLGLSEDLRGPLKKLGDIRNRFAHHPDAVEIMERDVNELFDTFTGSARNRVLSFMGLIQETLGEAEGTFEHQQPTTRFVLMVLVLHNSVEDEADAAASS